MKLVTVTGEIRVEYKLQYLKAGTEVTYQDTSYPVTMYKMSERISVDTGEFVANVYRNNPYLIFTGEGRSGHYYMDWKHPDFYNPTTYSHHFTVSGNLYFPAFEAARKAVLQNDFGYSNQTQIALQKAYAKVGGSDIGSGENLAEMRETIQTLVHPMKQLRDYLFSHNYHNLGLLNRLSHYLESLTRTGKGRWTDRGGKLMHPKDAALAAAGAWMELRYGIRPIVMTVQDVIDLLKKQTLAWDPNRIHTKQSKYEDSEVMTGYKGSARRGSVYFDYDVKVDVQRTTRAWVHYKRDFGRPLSEVLGLAPQFLPELAWELTTKSFVVDWWFSVGDWLGSYRVKPGVTILGNAVGKKVTAKCFGRGKVYGGDYKSPKIDLPPLIGNDSYYSIESYERLVDQHLPLFPLVTLHLPDLYEAVDSVAIILQDVLNKLYRPKRLTS